MLNILRPDDYCSYLNKESSLVKRIDLKFQSQENRSPTNVYK